MTITNQIVAAKIADYLHHKTSLALLVDWSENVLMDADFLESDSKTLSEIIARLGVADVRAFGLTWEECEELLNKLGYSTRIEIVSA